MLVNGLGKVTLGLTSVPSGFRLRSNLDRKPAFGPFRKFTEYVTHIEPCSLPSASSQVGAGLVQDAQWIPEPPKLLGRSYRGKVSNGKTARMAVSPTHVLYIAALAHSWLATLATWPMRGICNLQPYGGSSSIH